MVVSMTLPILHGPAYSTYVRTVRLALLEKGVTYTHDSFDILDGVPSAQHARHPFGKAPAFTHGDIVLYETVAICRYIDEAFDGPALQPTIALDRARMTQICAILDAYTFAPALGVILTERILAPMAGRNPKENLIKAAAQKANKAFAVLEAFVGERETLVGDHLSLADLHLIPNYFYFLGTPEGETIAQNTPGLRRWWDAMRNRASVKSTEPTLP